MAEFKLKIRRYDPESGAAPYWDEHTVELELCAVVVAVQLFAFAVAKDQEVGRTKVEILLIEANTMATLLHDNPTS